MVPYVVQAGDHLRRLAFEKGFDPDDVWNDSSNKALRDQGRTPDILAPGDVLYVPESSTSPPASVPTGKTTRFRAEMPRATIRLTLEAHGQPLANEPCVIEGLASPWSKRTDDQGKISLEIPVLVSELRLLLPARKLTYTLLVGHLDPVETEPGVCQRLTHLGFIYHDEEPTADVLREALCAFQAKNGLPVTGVTDDTTRGALARAHGS